MALRDLWDYVRASGDRRFREQGYVTSGMGILERYRKSAGFWAPHLEQNRRALLKLAARLGPERGGTLLVLGAGRLLDVPWEQLFPRFERVVLYDADFCIVQYVERIMSACSAELPKPLFEIGDVTASVVDTAAWAGHAISAARSAQHAAAELARGFDAAGTPQAPFARTYSDVRLSVSTNLLSQLGYYPRRHVQNVFKERFQQPFEKFDAAARSLEKYFDRVRARHIYDLCAQRRSWSYLSSDVDVVTYKLAGREQHNLLAAPPPRDAGVRLDERGELAFDWKVELVERSDPLNGQKIRELWPEGAAVTREKWVWHIVPQGSEHKYRETGRVHLVEGWTRAPSE